MPLPNIHLNKSNYPKSGEGALNVSTISNISHISQVYAENPKQSMLYAVGLQTAIPAAIPHVYR